MAKSQFARGHALGFASSALFALALVSCGTLTAAGSGTIERATQPSHFCVAAIEGSPEEAALARGHCSRSSLGVAPIEGTPEQTAVDLGR
jgi:hypothetical protein